MTIDLQFNEENWQHVERAWTAWWAGELERPLVVIEGWELPPGITVPNNYGLGPRPSEFPLDLPADRVLDYYEVRLQAKRFYGDAWPKWWPDFGPGIMAGFLGARVLTTAETVWFEPSETTSVESLQLRCDADNRWWRRVLQLTRRAVERWGEQVSIGHTDLGGNLDILSSLRGSESLLNGSFGQRDLGAASWAVRSGLQDRPTRPARPIKATRVQSMLGRDGFFQDFPG